MLNAIKEIFKALILLIIIIACFLLCKIVIVAILTLINNALARPY